MKRHKLVVDDKCKQLGIWNKLVEDGNVSGLKWSVETLSELVHDDCIHFIFVLGRQSNRYLESHLKNFISRNYFFVQNIILKDI